MALRPSGESVSTELWILLASWHVTIDLACSQYVENSFAGHVCSSPCSRLPLLSQSPGARLITRRRFRLGECLDQF